MAPSKKISKLFDSIAFFYPHNAPDHAQVKQLINSHSGTVVDVPSTANYYLLPVNWATKYSEDEDHQYYDVSIVEDWIANGKIAYPDDYVVNKQFPIAPATKAKLKGARRPAPPAESSLRVETSMSPRRRTTDYSPREIPPSSPIGHWSESRGRVNFTDEDDYKIIRFVEKAHAELERRAMEKAAGINVKYSTKVYSANGQQLWHQAVAANLLPGRTWQGIEGRFKKYIKGNWDTIMPSYRRWLSEQPTSPVAVQPIAKKRR